MFGKLRQDCGLKASLDYLLKDCLQKQHRGPKSQDRKSYIFIHLKISLLIFIALYFQVNFIIGLKISTKYPWETFIGVVFDA